MVQIYTYAVRSPNLDTIDSKWSPTVCSSNGGCIKLARECQTLVFCSHDPDLEHRTSLRSSWCTSWLSIIARALAHDAIMIALYLDIDGYEPIGNR